MSGLCTRLPDGVRLTVRVTPRAARNAIAGVAAEADGATALRVTVTAPPENGKANAAAVRLLARAWRVPKSSITIVSGAGTRRKGLMVAGAPAKLAGIIEKSAGAGAKRRTDDERSGKRMNGAEKA